MSLITMPEFVKILIYTTIVFIIVTIITAIIKTMGAIYNAYTIKRYRYIIECQISAVKASKNLIKALLFNFNRSYTDSVIEESFSSVQKAIRERFNKFIDSGTASVLYGVLNENDRNELVESLIAECWDEIKCERNKISEGRPIYLYPSEAPDNKPEAKPL